MTPQQSTATASVLALAAVTVAFIGAVLMLEGRRWLGGLLWFIGVVAQPALFAWFVWGDPLFWRYL